jgi:hypothetical protein
MRKKINFKCKIELKLFRWSYGIVLWEIMTLGGEPYPDLPMGSLFEFLRNNNRMSKPDLCPDGMYKFNICLNLCLIFIFISDMN